MFTESEKYKIASELINKGYLIHCTDAVFDSFDQSFIKGGFRAKEGYGFYFTSMPYKAITYGSIFKVIKKADFHFLRSSDEIDTSMFSNQDLQDRLTHLNYALDNVRNNREFDYLTSEIESIKKLLNNYDEELYFYIMDAIHNGAKTYGNLEYLIRHPQNNIPKLISVYLSNGYDGYETDGIYTVFNFDKLNHYFEEIGTQELYKLCNESMLRNSQMQESYSNKKRIIISESQFKKLVSEDVFVSNADKSAKRATLTYNKNGGRRNKGNLNSFDMLKTDKMDKLDNDTYERMLKCGVMSYNITSIKGSEVMHYFKRKFANQKSEMKINNETYELAMEDSSFKEFLDTFQKKVSTVINYQSSQYLKDSKQKEFSNLFIYPVPSSSNFNNVMSKFMSKMSLSNLVPRIIDSKILKKDTSNLTTDDEFISDNQEYYNSQLNDKSGDKTHLDHINRYKNKLLARQKLQLRIDKINDCAKKLISKYYTRNALSTPTTLTEKFINKLEELYNEYVDAFNYLKVHDISYYDPIDGKENKLNFNDSIQPIKYSKGPSIELRSKEILNILNQYGRLIKRGPKNIIPIQFYELKNFEVKNMPNDVRMGMKNYFTLNKEKFAKEKINNENSVVVVFDDNISGGATLNDICMRLKEVGFNYIIPITFGEMNVKWGVRSLPISMPQNGKFKHEM